MTGTKPTLEVDWRLVVRSLKASGTKKSLLLVEKAILEAGGIPLWLREASLTTSAAGGQPAIIETDDGLACVIALDDLVDVVVERGPTLREVMAAEERRRESGQG
ncbi:hypothetical protein [Agrobacterium cavarae]